MVMVVAKGHSELMKYLVFLCFQPFFVQIGPLLPIKSAISIKALCEWEVFVEIEEGADFHVGVYVVLNRNIWGSRILEPWVTVTLECPGDLADILGMAFVVCKV